MSGGALHLLLSYPRKWINSNKKQNIYRARFWWCSAVFFVCTTIIDQVLQLFSPARLGYIIALRQRLEDKQQGDAESNKCQYVCQTRQIRESMRRGSSCRFFF